jgi:multidrug efflux pump
VVSLTLVPMMSARWLKSHADENQCHGPAHPGLLRPVIVHYDHALVWVLERQA